MDTHDGKPRFENPWERGKKKKENPSACSCKTQTIKWIHCSLIVDQQSCGEFLLSLSLISYGVFEEQASIIGDFIGYFSDKRMGSMWCQDMRRYLILIIQ